MSDADDIFNNYASDPEVTRYVTFRSYNDQNEVAPFLQSRLFRWDSGEEYSWVLTVPAEDRAIGMIGCRVREHAADIGYVLGRARWGRGYATEAATAIVDWAAGSQPFIVYGRYAMWRTRHRHGCWKKSACSAKVFLGDISFIRTSQPSQETVLCAQRFVK